MAPLKGFSLVTGFSGDDAVSLKTQSEVM